MKAIFTTNKVFTSTLATSIRRFLVFRKFAIAVCLITAAFITNPYTVKAQAAGSAGLKISGAGNSDANGIYIPAAPNNGHPAWSFSGPTSNDYYIYFSSLLNQWVMQYQNKSLYYLVGVSYYCNAYDISTTDRPDDNGWFVSGGLNPPAPSSQSAPYRQYYRDTDGDGYAPDASIAKSGYYVASESVIPGYIITTSVLGTNDCNDYDASVYPRSFYVDADRDGYGTGGLVTVCAGVTPPSGYSANNTDCNDNDATKHASYLFYVDADGDGYGTGSAVSLCAVNATTAPSGYSPYNTDCDDNNATIHPYPFYVDADGDGYGIGNTVSVCAVGPTTPPAGYSTNNKDCNDNNATAHPYLFYIDADGDGYGTGSVVSLCAVNASTPPTGYSVNNTDCNDNDASSHTQPIVTVSITNATPCIGSAITLTASGASTYYWSDGILNGVPFIPTATHTYFVSVAKGSCYASTTRTITVNPLPTISVSANNPTFCNSSTTALNFDGVDDYIAQPISINGNSGTWEAWVQKANWNDPTDQRLFGNGLNATANNCFYISLHPGVGFHFRYGGSNQAGNNYVSSLTTQSFAANSWHHLAAAWSWNGSQTILVLYIDGVAVANNIAPLNLSLNAPSYIGGDVSNPKFGAGSMKEISLWNIPRTATEIANTYASSTTYPQTGLVSLLNFNNTTAYGTNTNTIVDAANAAISTLNNFTLSGASSNYILQNVPINRSVILTATGATTYSWNNGITNGVSFMPTVSNTYTVTGTDANGCVNTASQIVTINQAPTISITASATSVCIPSSTVLNFDGVNDYISQPIAINGASGTWQAWVQKVNWNDATDQRLFGNGLGATANNCFYISLHPGVGFHFRYGGINQAGNNYVSSLVTQSFAANSWHHLAAAWSWNGSQTILVLYIDGVAVTNNIATLNLSLNAPSYIGGDASNPKFGAGSMKEISLWSIPRTANDIATTYAGSTAYPQTGLVSLLNFNNAIAYGTNTNTITDNANAAVATLNNFALTGSISNYISSVVPIVCTPITLTASGASTYSWSNGITNAVPFGLNTNTTYTVTGTNVNGCTSTASQAITINPSYTITASGGTNGSISNIGATTICSGNNQTYTITPNNGFGIDSVLVDGAFAGRASTYTFNNVTAVHTIRAVFAVNCTPTISTFTVATCGSYTWVAKGNMVYTASNNTDTIHLTNAGGCDSLVTLNLTITSLGTWTGATNTDFNTASNWSCNTLPTATTNVIVPSTTNQPILSANAIVHSVELQTGSSLGLGSFTLSATGNIINNSSITGTGKLVLNGTVNQLISGVGTVSNVELNNTVGATIASGSHTLAITNTYLPTNGILTTNGNLTIASGASITGNYVNINGAVTLQQNVIGQRGYRMFANPFTTATDIATVATNNAIAIATTANAGSGLTDSRTFNNSTNLWGNVTGSTWAANTPYALFVRGLNSEVNGLIYSGGPTPFTYNVSGTLNGASTSITPSSSSNFMLVGNPYAAPVNSQALTGGASTSYYTYQMPVTGTPRVKAGSWVPSLSSNATNTIPVLGVVAYKPTSTSTFTISTADINTTGDLQAGLFGTTEPIINLALLVKQNGILQDKLFLRHDAKATDNGKDEHDLPKFFNDNLNLYTRSVDTSYLAVDARDAFKNIPIGISGLVGNYTFKVANNNFPSSTVITLEDNYLKTQTVLNTNSLYNFSITSDAASKGEKRFVLNAGSVTILPVQLTNITAQLQTDKTVAVNWTSATELNLANYNLQRSKNGSSFSTIGNVAAKGASMYNYNDDLSNAGTLPATIYYRLEAVDKDGSKTYSKTVAVVLGSNLTKTAILIYPNPVKATLNAQVTVGNAGAAQLHILDVQGKIVTTQQTHLAIGTTFVSITLSNQLVAGSYILEIDCADGKLVQRFVKE